MRSIAKTAPPSSETAAAGGRSGTVLPTAVPVLACIGGE
jgi:hypothetical protein